MMTKLTGLISFILLILLISTLVHYKIKLVERASKKALENILQQGLTDGNWKYNELINKYNPVGNLSRNVLHPFKWTYNSMFKGL